MTTVRREPRRVRRARRAAAFHAARTNSAASPMQKLQAAESALTAAAKHTRRSRDVATVRDDIAGHVAVVLDRAQVTGARRALYDNKLAAGGDAVRRLATTLWCLRAALQLLPDTERDHAVEHYASGVDEETRRLNQLRGGR